MRTPSKHGEEIRAGYLVVHRTFLSVAWPPDTGLSPQKQVRPDKSPAFLLTARGCSGAYQSLDRAFEQRAAIGAAGRNWLLFGAPHARHDFLYQLEWQQALKSGQLHRLDLAFSRDQADKVYVQHRLREHGRALFDWLEGGAHLYVCGATAMGRDVEAALLDVVATHGGRDEDAARDYLARLQQQGRYARDVY